MACGTRDPAAAGRRSLSVSSPDSSGVASTGQDSRHREGRSSASVCEPAGATGDARAADTTPRARWRTSTRDGATSRDAPVRARRRASGARVDVVDAFFRTLLVDGHAEAYAGRGPTTRRDATGASRRRVARDGGARRRERARDSRTCARSITPRRRRADEDDKGRHAASSATIFDRRRRRRASRARRRARDRTRRAIGRARVTPRWE